MSILSSLLEAVIANEALDALGEYRSKKRQAKEQQRKDDLFWQDAVRRENSDEF